MTQEMLDAQQIKEKCDMFDVCDALGLKKIGARTYQCPFPDNHAHGDANASMVVFPLLKGFKCFVPHRSAGGGEYSQPFEWGGDVFKLVMDIKRMRFVEAVDFVRRVTASKTIDPAESQSGAIVASRSVDYSLWGPLLFKFMAGARPAVNYPEIVERFERLAISAESLAKANVRYLEDPEATLKRMLDKYSAADLSHCGLIYDDGSLKFKNHRIIVPFYAGTYISHLHGIGFTWEENYETRDLRNEITSIFNQEKLPALEAGTLVYICYGMMDVLSCYEILKNQRNAVVIGLFDNRFYSDWIPLFQDLRIQILFPSSKDEYAHSLKDMLSKSATEIMVKTVPSQYLSLNDYLRGLRNGGSK